jgi:hypothetical protein
VIPKSIALLFLLAVLSHADTLVLRNGKRVTGRWWATDGKVITFLINNRLEYFSQMEVAEVVFGDEPQPPVKP